MILKWIEKARTKPKAVRNGYAFIGASIITSCIVVLWALSLPSQFAEIQQEKGVKEQGGSKGAFAQFFGDAKANLAGIIQSAGNPLTPTASTTSESEEAVESDVVIPNLTASTVEQVRGVRDVALPPTPRTVLIGTTSAKTEMKLPLEE